MQSIWNDAQKIYMSGINIWRRNLTAVSPLTVCHVLFPSHFKYVHPVLVHSLALSPPYTPYLGGVLMRCFIFRCEFNATDPNTPPVH